MGTQVVLVAKLGLDQDREDQAWREHGFREPEGTEFGGGKIPFQILSLKGFELRTWTDILPPPNLVPSSSRILNMNCRELEGTRFGGGKTSVQVLLRH